MDKILNIPLLNPWNIRCFFRLFLIFVNPISYVIYLLFPFKPRKLKIRTPIGKINVLLRNRQSARTLYSIFIRQDYLIDNKTKNILDLGSNIGISALYFLTRNKNNKILCIEPDPNNAFFLESNLNKFRDRSQIFFCAISSKRSKNQNFNVSTDGKYSSLIDIGSSLFEKISVDVITIDDALCKAKFNENIPILLKIDIEGLEKEVINNFDFKANQKINELIVEGTGYSNYINRPAVPKIVNGYVEKYKFTKTSTKD